MFFNNTTSWAALGGVSGVLILATLLSDLFHRTYPTGETHKTKLRVKTWWVISCCFFAALAIGPIGIYLLFGLVSIFALKEILSLENAHQENGTAWLFMACTSIGYYFFLAFAPSFIPVWGIIVGIITILSLPLVVSFFTEQGMGGMSKMVYVLAMGGVSHIVLFCGNFLGNSAGSAQGMHLIFLLVLLTSLNDVAQYLWGKSIGEKKIFPRISPNKTWAGFLGGILTTGVIACFLAPVFSSLSWQWGGAAGIIIGLAGFAGDIIFSIFKRANCAEESGNLLPGHGGILDRIDSLSVSAPTLYYFMKFAVVLNK